MVPCLERLAAARGCTVILVFIDHFTRWVELIALKKAEVSDVLSCLRNVWMPTHSVPAVLLPDNGPQGSAGVLREYWGAQNL